MATETVERISAEESQRRMRQNSWIVCAYDDASKCAKYQIPGSMTLADLKPQTERLPKNQELIFYCA